MRQNFACEFARELDFGFGKMGEGFMVGDVDQDGDETSRLSIGSRVFLGL